MVMVVCIRVWLRWVELIVVGWTALQCGHGSRPSDSAVKFTVPSFKRKPCLVSAVAGNVNIPSVDSLLEAFSGFTKLVGIGPVTTPVIGLTGLAW
jgi:hypothetical protein